MRRSLFKLLSLLGMGLICGCQLFVDDADRQVYHLIGKRQQAALGEKRKAQIDSEHSPSKVPSTAYDFTPHPIDVAALEGFTPPASQPETTGSEPAAAPATQPARAAATQTAQETAAREPGAPASQPADVAATGGAAMDLADALNYAFAHARQFQNAKEDLYLAALALTLERHLWTPQFQSEFDLNYANNRNITSYDHALSMVARASVEQRLPFGGEVSAQVVNTLMRDLTNHVTSAETGEVILAANIPLLRGAGMVALESRFQAERNLIYAVRDFEHFRQTYAVQVAGDYLNLQQLRQRVVNAHESTKIYLEEVARARALKESGRLIPLEVQRAEQNQLFSYNNELDARETYRTALDSFKIEIGMPVTEPIDVEPLGEATTVAQAAGNSADPREQSLKEALTMPAVDEPEAIRIGLKYRLDLLNELDFIGDAERGVSIAENRLLPDLTITGSTTYPTDPAVTSSYHYNVDRVNWATGLKLEIPLDRVAERNNLRKSQILKRRAERLYAEGRDQVAQQIRTAMHRVELSLATLEIQIRSRDLALRRRSYARYLFDTGKASNREVQDAEDALLTARNRLALAQTGVLLAVLQFRRDTGTLRLDDQGHWAAAVVSAARSR